MRGVVPRRPDQHQPAGNRCLAAPRLQASGEPASLEGCEQDLILDRRAVWHLTARDENDVSHAAYVG